MFDSSIFLQEPKPAKTNLLYLRAVFTNALKYITVLLMQKYNSHRALSTLFQSTLTNFVVLSKIAPFYLCTMTILQGFPRQISGQRS